jgi:hypothetical protein
LRQGGHHGEENERSDKLKEGMKENTQNKKSNRFTQALSLPSLCNLNPRSVYNKRDEFHALVKEEQLDVIFLSESWERDYLPLEKIIDLEDHTVISNVHQRTGMGGRPAIIANHKKYHVQNLTNSVIQIPWGVEAVWCVLTPKNITHDSKIQKIACCALYSKPNSKITTRSQYSGTENSTS